MLSSKLLAAFCTVASLAAVSLAGDYSDGYDEGSSYYDDEGSSYYDDSYYDDGSYSYGGDSYLPAFAYTYDAEYAAGISGSIKVQYAGPFSTFAVITADLDFSGVDAAQITAFNGNCTGDVTEYKWHIHVKWPHDEDSASFEQCALAVAGNHFDPLKACSKDSEFAGTDDCLLKTPDYDCNPDAYAKNPLVCEEGDLAGKFGNFQLDEHKKVSGEWYDPNYPLPAQNTPEFNIILHAVCGDVAPRIACAVGKAVDSAY